MIAERDVRLPGGRTLHAYDAGGPPGALPVLWHHGTPNVGEPPAPLLPAAARLGLRLLGYDRPGYGGSTPRPDRSIGSAAGDAAAVCDALGVGRFAVMGHSGGGSHALACAALLPARVTAAVSASAPSPRTLADFDWFAGMVPSSAGALRAAAAGRAEMERYEASAPPYDPEFTAADLALLEGPWGWLGDVVARAARSGRGPAVDDDLAYAAPWGFDPAAIAAPVLVVHGGRDGIVPPSHGAWLARRIPGAELRLSPDDGHVSVLRGAEAALEWLAARGR